MIRLNLYGGIHNSQSFTRKQPRNRATAQPRNRATAQPRNRAISGGTLFFNRGKISGGNSQFQFKGVIFRRKGAATRGNRVRVRTNGAANCRNRVGSQTNRVCSGFNGVAIRDNGARFCCNGVDFCGNGVKPPTNGVFQKIKGFPLKRHEFHGFSPIAAKERKRTPEFPHPSYRTPSPIGWDGVMASFSTLNPQLTTDP
jgi:hypothetical protein